MSTNSTRIPPQNLEAEESVLGAILLDKDAIVQVADVLRPDHFYSAAHKGVFSAMLVLYEAREYITTADVDGDFAQTIEVDAGGNRVTIVATTQDGAQESVIRNIVYSTVDLNNNSATESATAETEE